jgi:hypothetical protein
MICRRSSLYIDRRKRRTPRRQTLRGEKGLRPIAQTLGRPTFNCVDDAMRTAGERRRTPRGNARRLPFVAFAWLMFEQAAKFMLQSAQHPLISAGRCPNNQGRLCSTCGVLRAHNHRTFGPIIGRQAGCEARGGANARRFPDFCLWGLRTVRRYPRPSVGPNFLRLSKSLKNNMIFNLYGAQERTRTSTAFTTGT